MDDQGYFHSFPAVQGFQAGRPFFIAMCPLRMVPKLFVFDEEEVPAELRAQRTLNRGRVPAISHYLVAHPSSYVLSALTASVDGQVRFLPFDKEKSSSLGILEIPMDAKILINDGQHRRAAIEEAIKESPSLGQDNVPVLFFGDEGLGRSQQMFADLNKYAVRPSYSLSTLYDQRDPSSELARYLAAECRAFKGLTEMEKSTISNRSVKLFTLSSIKHASRALLRKNLKDDVTPGERMVAKEFWDVLSDQIPDWQRARTRDVATAELRQEFVHAHGVTLQALALAGAEVLSQRQKSWKKDLQALRKIDWARSNASIWEGRAMTHGRISKAATNVHLAANYIKSVLSLPLSPEDLALEALLPPKQRITESRK
ncbi:MAG: DNA sulfur modification protein DndB [Polaromonas sp.]|uniref:DNA sulfur modification protein DndB n=1 Tax=Polaromonas sp. TaxID=1869339 RepID=UPI00273113FC|nr:DNA sulfur modification protein DndB [Polaromonas sp.]MDP2450754.1 DNA sulfur modification protein DndB [Polaromonas sp.]MDP3246259.1 DNA sulfur modification protein DndB [Polaromonas sp.]MDP3754905.1 DNA sulfur modification protein DndB [Polaromonas sp.]MDP3825692.1 DNA sulfur modification protein DndB [Polaromonas sp.]